MNAKLILLEVGLTFAVTLVVAAMVTHLYSLLVHGAGVVDWETSFRSAIIFAIILPWTWARIRKRSER